FRTERHAATTVDMDTHDTGGITNSGGHDVCTGPAPLAGHDDEATQAAQALPTGSDAAKPFPALSRADATPGMDLIPVAAAKPDDSAGPLSGVLQDLHERAAGYATRARGAGTLRTYRSAWRAWEAWCASLGRAPLPGEPRLLAMYAVHCADRGLSVSSLRVHLAAILAAHRLAGLPLDANDPRLAMVVEGIVRSRGTRPRRQAAAAVPATLRQMLAARLAPPSPLGLRDRALLLLGFAAALRRSELVALCLGDVTPVAGRGLRVLVRRSKTDQRGVGQEVAIRANHADPALCPVVALQAWLAVRHQGADLDGLPPEAAAEAPLFVGMSKAGRLSPAKLSDRAVSRLVGRAARDAGIERPERFSGHSLRAGFATAAGEAGVDLAHLMRQTRHKSADTALGYLRPTDLWRNNPTQAVWEAVTREEDENTHA
ncbi:MAG: site-specific integrase, partial [Janthinobacterium lividum]